MPLASAAWQQYGKFLAAPTINRVHDTGDFAESVPPLPLKPDPQQVPVLIINLLKEINVNKQNRYRFPITLAAQHFLFRCFFKLAAVPSASQADPSAPLPPNAHSPGAAYGCFPPAFSKR